MLHHHHGLTGDYTTIGLLLVSNSPMILSMAGTANEVLQVVALGSGILASVVVFIDHTLKIHWKIKQRRNEKREKDGE